MPRTLREAIERLERAEGLRRAMGEEVIEHYVHAARWGAGQLRSCRDRLGAAALFRARMSLGHPDARPCWRWALCGFRAGARCGHGCWAVPLLPLLLLGAGVLMVVLAGAHLVALIGGVPLTGRGRLPELNRAARWRGATSSQQTPSCSCDRLKKVARGGNG
ncbi:MAG: hypothetical protein U1E17_09115 [Geminicoccaceae bacterium]